MGNTNLHSVIRSYWVCGVFLCALMSSCYSERKAANQFGRATAAYPGIAANFCAVTYPPKERTTPGATVIIRDTLPGLVHMDTTRVMDTMVITRFIQGPTIREVSTRVDTIVVVNQAEVTACRLDLTKTLGLLKEKTDEAAKWREIARTRFWVIFGLGALLAGAGVWIVKRK